MQSYTCPSCGAEVKFQSSVSITCVCPYCRTLIVRHDKNVEDMGKMAELPDDISPFQIGTEGIYNHVHFALIGRVRMAWEDGGWNEWFMWFDDGKKGWLSEAEGFLAISFEVRCPQASARSSFGVGPELSASRTKRYRDKPAIFQRRGFEKSRMRHLRRRIALRAQTGAENIYGGFDWRSGTVRKHRLRRELASAGMHYRRLCRV